MRERPNTQSTNLHTNLPHTMLNLHHTILNLHHTILNHITNQHPIIENPHIIKKTSTSLFSSHFHLTLSHTFTDFYDI